MKICSFPFWYPDRANYFCFRWWPYMDFFRTFYWSYSSRNRRKERWV